VQVSGVGTAFRAQGNSVKLNDFKGLSKLGISENSG
jgi:hypothetical protein